LFLFFLNGLIVMGDLPKKKKGSHCNGWPTHEKVSL
jgi:hypothetical protein